MIIMIMLLEHIDCWVVVEISLDQPGISSPEPPTGRSKTTFSKPKASLTKDDSTFLQHQLFSSGFNFNIGNKNSLISIASFKGNLYFSINTSCNPQGFNFMILLNSYLELKNSRA